MLRLGSLNLHSRFILSAMAGISDLPFRLLNREFGAELAFIEMINARSLGYRSKKTRKMLATCPSDKPLGVQLLGCEPKYIQRALDILKNYEFDLLDFNAACPMKKVVRRGEGAALLQEPKKLQALLKLIVRSSEVPVTVKIRSGWDEKNINAAEVALLCEDAGVAGLFIHGRTKRQVYSGRVDYRIIGEVKKRIRIPVIASGDIFSVSLAKQMLDETGCDAVAVARGALGNPWIFQQLNAGFTGKGLPVKPSIEEVVRVMLGHLGLCVSFHGEKSAVIIFRKFFSWYTKGLRKIRPLREKVSRIKTQAQLEQVIRGLAQR